MIGYHFAAHTMLYCTLGIPGVKSTVQDKYSGVIFMGDTVVPVYCTKQESRNFHNKT